MPITRGVESLFIALRKKPVGGGNMAIVRSIGSLPFDLAYPRLDTGTSSDPSLLNKSRRSAMTRPPVERTILQHFSTSGPQRCTRRRLGVYEPNPTLTHHSTTPRELKLKLRQKTDTQDVTSRSKCRLLKRSSTDSDAVIPSIIPVHQIGFSLHQSRRGREAR